MGELAQAAEAAQMAQERALSGEDMFRAVLKQQIPAMRKVMPEFVTPARMLQLGMDCYRRNPQLAECPPDTVVSALMTCSALGLEPSAVDGLGRAYIIPRWNRRTRRKEAAFELGYPGAIELMLRSGKVLDIYAEVVYERDDFSYRRGTDPTIHHVPCDLDDPGRVTHVYCVATLPGGIKHLEVMNRREIEKRRQVSAAKDKGPWVDHYGEMAKKTVVLYASKWLPKSVELQRAVDADWTVAPEPAQVAAPEPVAEPVAETEPAPVAVEYETGEVA